MFVPTMQATHVVANWLYTKMPPRKPRVLTTAMTIRQPGQKGALVVPRPVTGPAQGDNITSRITFGAQALKDWPLLALRWAKEKAR